MAILSWTVNVNPLRYVSTFLTYLCTCLSLSFLVPSSPSSVAICAFRQFLAAFGIPTSRDVSFLRRDHIACSCSRRGGAKLSQRCMSYADVEGCTVILGFLDGLHDGDVLVLSDILFSPLPTSVSLTQVVVEVASITGILSYCDIPLLDQIGRVHGMRFTCRSKKKIASRRYALIPAHPHVPRCSLSLTAR